MKIKIFTTGGSIDKYYSTQTSDLEVGEPAIENILSEAGVTLEYEIESLFRKDSLNLTHDDRQIMLAKIEADPHRNILIIHGTDTMIETARTLGNIPRKTIVLTGAMQPAAFKRTDAYFNIGFAFSAIQLLPEGIYIAMNGQIWDPAKARKNLSLNRFENSR